MSLVHHPLCIFRTSNAHPPECRDEEGKFADWPRSPEYRDSVVRTFKTGATRDTEEGKLKYTGFLDPVVLRRYAEYMHEHRTQKDGTVRDADNWKLGMPLDSYIDSGVRHLFDLWGLFEVQRLTLGLGQPTKEELDLCSAVMFNIMGYMYQRLHGAKE